MLVLEHQCCKRCCQDNHRGRKPADRFGKKGSLGKGYLYTLPKRMPQVLCYVMLRCGPLDVAAHSIRAFVVPGWRHDTCNNLKAAVPTPCSTRDHNSLYFACRVQHTRASMLESSISKLFQLQGHGCLPGPQKYVKYWLQTCKNSRKGNYVAYF